MNISIAAKLPIYGISVVLVLLEGTLLLLKEVQLISIIGSMDLAILDFNLICTFLINGKLKPLKLKSL